jgi:hypothetical protein
MDHLAAGPAPMPPKEYQIPRAAVLFWTLPWVILVLTLLVNAVTVVHPISYDLYVSGRYVVIGAMLAMAVAGLLIALEIVGSHKGDPWFTVGLLVALVLFWALFPPSWFFVEYLSFDRGAFLLPSDLQEAYEAAEQRSDVKAMADLRAKHLGETKTYADLASKVWVAVGASLGSAIALTKK